MSVLEEKVMGCDQYIHHVHHSRETGYKYCFRDVEIGSEIHRLAICQMDKSVRRTGKEEKLVMLNECLKLNRIANTRL